MLKPFLTLLFATVLFNLSPPTFVAAWAAADPSALNTLQSPQVHGEVLEIQGPIDSHIYDYLSYEAIALKPVKIVELNSLGGNVDWALQISEKLRAMKITTRLSSGHVCASACTYLFAAGQEREAAADTWFGIHGARLGVGYTSTFQGLCFDDLEDGTSEFNRRKKGCQAFLNQWYTVTQKATLDSFNMMEANGVLPALRETYLGMSDDSDWPAQLNVFRKPDWVLRTPDSVKFNWVTKIL